MVAAAGAAGHQEAQDERRRGRDEDAHRFHGTDDPRSGTVHRSVGYARCVFVKYLFVTTLLTVVAYVLLTR
ncbi:hypothetical protein GCM10009727_50770 [Actinomadura napierensis]|uniref:Uncharacterized protein n=1 Tax=Actinomadura napierensis TaxID=267854 RepID=A0ABN2ZUW5_9ACTN